MPDETPKDIVRQIAARVLGIRTLDRRNRDSLDFRNIAVWEIERALIEAYERGVTDARKESK